MKKLIVTVEDWRGLVQDTEACYKVVKMVNTTKFRVGQYITQSEVDEMNESKTFQVNIIPIR